MGCGASQAQEDKAKYRRRHQRSDSSDSSSSGTSDLLSASSKFTTEYASLNPDAIVQLLSAVPPQVESNARQTWANLSSLPAVRNGRVHVINKWYTQLPGFHLPDLAEEMAEALHPTAGK